MKKNEMMDRPIVQENVVQYLRESQRQFTGVVRSIQQYANDRRIPIIPHETALFLDFLLSYKKVNSILEIGTAIGFSSIMMAQHLDEHGKIYTIDRFDVMIERAKQNFEKAGVSHQVTLLEGDAKDILPTLNEKFDIIFMDSAKSKYYDFLPYCIDLLNLGGLLIVDDIFQAGTVLGDISDIPRNQRKIHRQLKKFLQLINHHPALKSTTLPLGDGLVIIEKMSEDKIAIEVTD